MEHVSHLLQFCPAIVVFVLQLELVLFHSEQIQGQTVDIITGFKLIDEDMALFVLEGLHHGAMKELTEQNFRNIQPGK